MAVSLLASVPVEAKRKRQVQQPDEYGPETTTPTVSEDDGGPEGKPEIVDVSDGFRDDHFTSIAVEDGVAFVSTSEGRIYVSRDGGQDWEESTVIAAPGSYYGFAGQTAFSGSLRSSNTKFAEEVEMSGSSIYRLTSPESIESTPSISFTSLIDKPRHRTMGAPGEPLREATEKAAGSKGLKLRNTDSRAPRLNRWMRSRKLRTVEKRKLIRTVGEMAGRNSAVAVVTIGDSLFATTSLGLYRSEDGGISWLRVFSGMTKKESAVINLGPGADGDLYLGTQGGMFVSNDGGDSWSKNAAVPGSQVNRVLVDPTDKNFIYVATTGGVMRSKNRGQSFEYILLPSIPARKNALWIELDPSDPQRLYVGTADGLLKTNTARTADNDDFTLIAGLRTGGLSVPKISVDPTRPAHLYAMTRATLPHVNYGSHGPDSYFLESFDSGATWQVVMGGRTQGDIRWFELDPKNPKRVWVVWSRGLFRVERGGGRRATSGLGVAPGGPSMSQVVLAALGHAEVEMKEYAAKTARAETRNFLPSKISVSGYGRRLRIGGLTQDIQFGGDRFIRAQESSEFRVMVWATWSLPDLLFNEQAIPMRNRRVTRMNDQLRQQTIKTVHRNYGELQRVRAKQANQPDADLYTRVLRAVKAEQLEAVVDHATGGFLSKNDDASTGEK